MTLLWIDETLPAEEREKQKQMKADMKVIPNSHHHA